MKKESDKILQMKTQNEIMKKEPIHVISLGAGVQSSAMALMAAEGLITPMPDFAVFADTGDEPDDVYEWLNKLTLLLPFKVQITARKSLTGKLSDNLIQWNHSQIPAFMINPKTGKPGIGKRQCTKHWKIVPVQQMIRQVTGTKRKRLQRGFITLWQGISIDEVTRCKTSRDPWIENRFPLIEANLSRRQCVQWLAERGYTAPKSACIYCPYRSDIQWKKSKNIEKEWALI